MSVLDVPLEVFGPRSIQLALGQLGHDCEVVIYFDDMELWGVLGKDYGCGLYGITRAHRALIKAHLLPQESEGQYLPSWCADNNVAFRCDVYHKNATEPHKTIF